MEESPPFSQAVSSSAHSSALKLGHPPTKQQQIVCSFTKVEKPIEQWTLHSTNYFLPLPTAVSGQGELGKKTSVAASLPMLFIEEATSRNLQSTITKESTRQGWFATLLSTPPFESMEYRRRRCSIRGQLQMLFAGMDRIFRQN